MSDRLRKCDDLIFELLPNEITFLLMSFNPFDPSNPFSNDQRLFPDWLKPLDHSPTPPLPPLPDLLHPLPDHSPLNVLPTFSADQLPTLPNPLLPLPDYTTSGHISLLPPIDFPYPLSGVPDILEASRLTTLTNDLFSAN